MGLSRTGNWCRDVLAAPSSTDTAQRPPDVDRPEHDREDALPKRQMQESDREKPCPDADDDGCAARVYLYHRAGPLAGGFRRVLHREPSSTLARYACV